MKKLYYIHGMAGLPADWDEVTETVPGEKLFVPPSKLDSALSSLAAQVTASNYSLCGYSLGGRLAILLAIRLLAANRMPEHLILVASGLGFPAREERERRMRQDLIWADLARKSPSEFWQKWYSQDLFKSLTALSESKRAGWISRRLSINFNDLSSYFKKMSPGRHEHLLPLLKQLAAKGVKVLYIAGELDKKYCELADEIANYDAVSTLIIPGAGHVVPLEKPRELAQAIKAFTTGASHGQEHR